MIYRIVFLFWFSLFSLSLHAAEKTVLILGDSLSAAHGIAVDEGWVNLLRQRLTNQGYAFNVVNASISGETTLGALSRLDTLLEQHNPAIAVVELGGNDGLRGFPFTEIEQNLSAIISKLKQHGSRVLLVPMQLPPNYGQAYNQQFMKLYSRVASEHDVKASTFILEDIALNEKLMQADGIHPVAAAQPLMLDNIWPQLEPMLEGNLALQ